MKIMLDSFMDIVGLSPRVLCITELEHQMIMRYNTYGETFRNRGYLENYFYECFLKGIDVQLTTRLRNKGFTLTEIQAGEFNDKGIFEPLDIYCDIRINIFDSSIDNNNSLY